MGNIAPYHTPPSLSERLGQNEGRCHHHCAPLHTVWRWKGRQTTHGEAKHCLDHYASDIQPWHGSRPLAEVFDYLMAVYTRLPKRGQSDRGIRR
eukprot:6206340-Pleurochrysis_carterae.AAC.1